MATATQPHKHWKAKVSGATLEVVLGEDTTGTGGTRLVTRGVVTSAGRPVEGPLAPNFVERWEAGDESARAIVDKVDKDGNLTGESKLSARSDEVEEAEARARALEAQVASLQAATATEAAADLDAANERVAEAESELDKVQQAAVEQQERADAAERSVESIAIELAAAQARVAELEAAPQDSPPPVVAGEALTHEQIGELKGQALDAALGERGLLDGNKSKSPDEKKLLLAGYEAARPAGTDG